MKPHQIEREMARRYAAGESAAAIAGDYGVVHNVVLRAVRAQGGVVRPGGGRLVVLPKRQQDCIREEFAAGVSAYSLGKRFCCDPATIRRIADGIVPEAEYLPSPEEIETATAEIRLKRLQTRIVDPKPGRLVNGTRE